MYALCNVEGDIDQDTVHGRLKLKLFKEDVGLQWKFKEQEMTNEKLN